MFQNFFFSLFVFLFFAFVKTFLCGKFKNFKTNKAILTIVIKRKESDNDEKFLGNISVQKKKIIQKSVWDWYLAVVCVIWGKGLGVTIQIFFPK